jgi:hypothetical protein
MVKINIRDKNFGGEPSSCHQGVNKHVEWEFGNTPVSNTCFITDLCLPDVRKASNVKRKVAWILEPRAIHPQVYQWIEDNNRLFDYVLTFDTDLVNKGQNYLYYPHGRCWINGAPTITKKDKLCSIIASSKNFTDGHQLRHKVIQNNYSDVDVFGYGYKPVESKREALDPYKFSITIENSIQPGYWTEKVVDCFATQTVPIFWGDRSVCNSFDERGIIRFSNIEQLEDILEFIRKDGDNVYKSKLAAIHENFQAVEKYRIPEDWIFNNYPFLFN